ncbi:MAG: GAF domain-containing protein [Nonomuraea sp.]|nr:GAF domain-containing protein [Nonomuraea sp.]
MPAFPHHAYGPRWAARVLQRTLRSLASICGVDGAALLMIAPDGRRLVVGATDDAGRRLEAAEVALDQGPAVRVVETGRPAAVADLRSGYETLAGLAGPVRSVLAVPLSSRSKVVGALAFYRRKAVNWDNADLVKGERLGRILVGVLDELARSQGGQGPPPRDQCDETTHK